MKLLLDMLAGLILEELLKLLNLRELRELRELLNEIIIRREGGVSENN